MENFSRLSERRRKEIATLQRKKGRMDLGQALVEGWRGVTSALDAGVPVIDLLAATGSEEDPRLPALVRRAGREAIILPDHVFARLSDVDTAQGILAVVPIRHLAIRDLVDMRRVIVLDGVQDPGNAGTIIRTAGWFGMDAVVAGPGSADPYHPKVVRATMGGLWDVGIAEVDDLVGTLAALTAAGFACVGADLHGEALAGWIPAERTALVLGSESHGLSETTLQALTHRVAIAGAPDRRGTESLNVAVAAGIMLYEWIKKSTSND
ncbi:MAG: RNA methyltransferase [Rhodothermales bacterium]|nr:RNA methyltransferase [Rhodothermales bacterium]